MNIPLPIKQRFLILHPSPKMAKQQLSMMIISVTMLTAAPLAFSFQLEESIHQLISYTRVWPEMEFGWRIVLATIVGFLAAASGGAGGSVGGGFFVSVFVLIVGFDIKSSAAMSNCMVMATAGATTYLNLKKKNPTLEQPLVDYDLVVLIHPMLLLGVGIGAAFNVILAEWMLTLLLVILFLVMSIKAFVKSAEAWNKETNATQEASQELNSIAGSDEAEYEPLLWSEPGVQLSTNVQYWKEVGVVVVAVWIAILALQISKSSTTSCSAVYWVLALSQIPVAVGAFSYEAMKLCRRNQRGSKRNWKAHEVALCCLSAVVAGAVSAMLGLGGGFILCPLFLHLGMSPQVSSATAALAITFSSSISVVEYYLLKRFPVPYAIYFWGVAIAATLVGDLAVRKAGTRRASVLIFVLASTILITALLLGADGIIDVSYKVENSEYMGFKSLCS